MGAGVGLPKKNGIKHSRSGTDALAVILITVHPHLHSLLPIALCFATVPATTIGRQFHSLSARCFSWIHSNFHNDRDVVITRGTKARAFSLISGKAEPKSLWQPRPLRIRFQNQSHHCPHLTDATAQLVTGQLQSWL